jgi:hypothetical protein
MANWKWQGAWAVWCPWSSCLTWLRTPHPQFEESLISAKMEQMVDDEADAGDAGAGNDEDQGEDFLLTDDGKDIDLRWDCLPSKPPDIPQACLECLASRWLKLPSNVMSCSGFA